MAERRFVTTTGSEKALDDIVLDKLGGRLRGALVRPGDPDYDRVRKVWNGMVDKRPALIARCADVDDVATAVGFARDHGLLLAIRGGGHNGAGLGTCDDGVVIDLSLLRDVEVDPGNKTVRVGAARDQRRPLVDHGVVDRARLVVVGVAGPDQPSPEPGEFLARRLRGRGHRAHASPLWLSSRRR